MEDLCICKICKKVFTDEFSLNKHKMAQHPQTQQSKNNINSSRDIIAHQFRNNSNISITKIRKETNNSVVSQSAMNQNQNSFLKAKGMASQSITVRRQEMKMKQQGEGARVRPPFRGPDVRIKQPATSITVVGRTGVEVDDDTTDWQKWEPPHPKERDNGPNNHAVPPGNPSRAGGAIISKSAAEMASSAFINSPSNSTTARKSVPQLLPMLNPQNGGQTSGNKRPAPSVKVSSTSQKLPSARNSISEIMQNLGKMKALNRPAPSPKLISIPSSQAKKGSPSVAAAVVATPSPKNQPQKQQANLPFRVIKPPQVSKNKAKILPRNALNNALPKPEAKGGKGSKTLEPVDDMEADSSDQPEDEEEPELFIQQPEKPLAKKSAPSPTKAAKSGTGGKVSPQKLLNSNRFNPSGPPPPKKIKVKADPPSFNTSSSSKGSANGKANGANKQPSSSATSAAVVAKKSNPPPAKKQKSNDATFKKLKIYVPNMPGTDYEMPKLTSIGSYTNRQGQQVWVCLVCNEKEQEESSRDMICCEMCEDWYHWECVGIRQAMEEEDPWYCKRCIYQSAHNPKKDFPKLFKNDVFDV